MDTLTFLQRVLPGEGYYVIAVEENGRISQGFFTTVDQLAAACTTANANGHNTYYAVSSFASRGKRTQANTHLTKVIAMDVDCGWDEKKNKWKPYKTQKAGAQAMAAFLRATGLPTPMVVNSGRGLHLYWVLDSELAPQDWQPLAERMKAMALQNEFHIDPTVTADSARILRPTQTINPKNGVMVDVLIDAPVVSVQLLQNLLSTVGATVETPPAAAPMTPPAGFGKYRESRVVGSLDVQNEFPPKDPVVLVEKCAQIKWGTENQASVSEPFWYAMMGVAAFCIDPDATAKAWSNQYPGYSEAETLKKVNQWKGSASGPATCKKFHDERPKGCTDCPLRGKIKSPAVIGARYEDAAPAAPEQLPVGVEAGLPLPWPFKRSKHPKTGENVIVQTLDGTDIEITPFDIYPVGYGRDHGLGYETVRYKWNRAHVGWQDLTFRQAYLTDGNREFATSLADQGIVLGGRKQTETFQFMLRSYMDELRAIKAMTNLHGTMGWKENNTQFVIGNRLYRRVDASVVREDITVAAGTQRLSNELYTCVGDLDAWKTTIDALSKMPEFAFSVGLGFGSPLMQFVGLKGVVVSLCGPTGSGKTLAQLAQQSIWGDPGELHFSAKYTQNTLFNRLGMYNNLPMTIDEATMMRDEDVGDFCYWVTQGKDKARLNRNADERETRTWANIVTISTNTAFTSKMVASGMETDAQMARLLEVNIPDRDIFQKDSTTGRKVYRMLSTNYGLAGDVYLKHIMSLGAEELKRRYEERLDTFQKRYCVVFSGTERYWEAAFVLFELGCELATEAGLITFDYAHVVQKMLRSIDALRRAIDDNQQDAFDLVTEYLRVYADQTITVMHTDNATPSLDTTRIPRGEVRVRLDLYRKSIIEGFDRGTVMLVATPFKQWLAANGVDIRAVKKTITEMGGDATPADKRFWFGRDTSLKYGQFHCVGVNLAHHRLAGFLRDQQQTLGDVTFGKLVAVE